MTLAKEIAVAVLAHLEQHTPGFVDLVLEKIEPGLEVVIQGALTTFGLPLIQTAGDIVAGKRDL